MRPSWPPTAPQPHNTASRAHHGQAHAPVAEHRVCQQLGSAPHRDALAVGQLVEAALSPRCVGGAQGKAGMCEQVVCVEQVRAGGRRRCAACPAAVVQPAASPTRPIPVQPQPPPVPHSSPPPGARTWRPRLRSQNWQSAAPPAMVPSRCGLISITFFTVWEAAGREWRQSAGAAAVQLGWAGLLSAPAGPAAARPSQHATQQQRAGKRTDVGALACARVHRNDHAALQGRGRRARAWGKGFCRGCRQSAVRGAPTPAVPRPTCGATSTHLEDEAQRGGAVVGLHILNHIPLKRVQLQQGREGRGVGAGAGTSGVCSEAWRGVADAWRRPPPQRCRWAGGPLCRGPLLCPAARRRRSPPPIQHDHRPSDRDRPQPLTSCTAGSGKLSRAGPQPTDSRPTDSRAGPTPATRQERSTFSPAIGGGCWCCAPPLGLESAARRRSGGLAGVQGAGEGLFPHSEIAGSAGKGAA